MLSEEHRGGLKRVDLDPPNRTTVIKTDLDTSNVLTVVHRQRQPDGEGGACSLVMREAQAAAASF